MRMLSPQPLLLAAVLAAAGCHSSKGGRTADLSGVDTLGEDTVTDHPAPTSGALPGDSLETVPADAQGPAPEHRSADSGEAVLLTPRDSTGALPAWTSTSVSTAATLSAGTARVVGIRTGRQSDFDRVVFDLEGRASGLPGYRVRYVDGPLHACGSGKPIHPAGQAWLEVRLEPAQAHGEGVTSEAKRDSLPADLPQVAGIYRTCDFEGVATWVLAVRSPEAFRAFTLDEPPRLVVDVRH